MVGSKYEKGDILYKNGKINKILSTELNEIMWIVFDYKSNSSKTPSLRWDRGGGGVGGEGPLAQVHWPTEKRENHGSQMSKFRLPGTRK